MNPDPEALATIEQLEADIRDRLLHPGRTREQVIADITAEAAERGRELLEQLFAKPPRYKCVDCDADARFLDATIYAGGRVEVALKCGDHCRKPDGFHGDRKDPLQDPPRR